MGIFGDSMLMSAIRRNADNEDWMGGLMLKIYGILGAERFDKMVEETRRLAKYLD